MSDKKKPVKTSEQRRKQAVVMHRMMHKLLAAKARKKHKHASGTELVRRSKHLAKHLFMKKIAGSRGKSYKDLPFSARAALDRVFDHMSPGQHSALAKKLLPQVKAHERARMKNLRKEETEINEKADRWTKVMRAMAAGERSIHKRKTAAAHTTAMKGGAVSFSKASSAKTLDSLDDMLNTTNSKSDQRFTRITRRDMASKHKSRMKRVRGVLAGQKKFVTRQTRGNQSKAELNRKAYQGNIRQDFDYDMAADFILEGKATTDKFEALFMRGLVAKSKIEIYKRIFGDLDRNIKFRRYHDEIVAMLERLIKLITNDGTIYNKITQAVQRRNHTNV